MKPLNGKCRMTREERNARRRELYANPFYRSLVLKRAKKSRDKCKDRANARRREKYAANIERERARSQTWRDANRDKLHASWKKWADKNREKLREYHKKRYSDPAVMERKRELRRIRESTPEGKAKRREMRRRSYYKNRNSASGLRHTLMFEWIPRWESLATEGAGAEERYLRKCFEKTRMYYRLWKSGSPMIDRIIRGGKA